jgi:hypothetical protein
MDINIESGFPIDCDTVYVGLYGIHPWIIGYLDNMMPLFVIHTWRVSGFLGGQISLEEDHHASWRKVLSPRWDGTLICFIGGLYLTLGCLGCGVIM